MMQQTLVYAVIPLEQIRLSSVCLFLRRTDVRVDSWVNSQQVMGGVCCDTCVEVQRESR